MIADYSEDEQQQLNDAAQAASELRQTEAAFSEIRAGLLEAFATSKMGETVLREKLHSAVQVLDQVKAMLTATALSTDVVNHNAMIRAAFAEAEQRGG